MLNPRFIDDMSWAMAEVYGATTDRILINLAKYFPMVKEGQPLPGSFQYQAQMLAKMGQVNRETAQIIIDTMGGADAALRQSLEAAIMEALKDVEPALRKAAQKGLLNGPGLLPPEVAPAQTQAFKAFYRQSADKLNMVNTVMLESTQEAYRATVADAAQRIQRSQSILNTEAGNAALGVSSYNQAMRDAVKRMCENNLTGFIDHAGHHWTPEAYAAMDIRTTMANTARAAVWERNETYGNDLYLVSSHAGARPLCYPWQGQVISRTNNERDVEDLDGNMIHVIAQSSTSYGQPAGLFGINCRHYPMEFIEGFTAINAEDISEEENERIYQLTQKQRGMERKLRGYRLDEETAKAQGDAEGAKRAHEAVRKQSAAIDDFCDKNGLPRRRAREYTPVNATWPDDKTYDPTTFPTATRDRIRDWYDNGGDDPPPSSMYLGPNKRR